MSFSSFIQDLEAQGHDLHAVQVRRRGQVVGQRWWAPYRPEARHVLYSLTKTFTALGALFAVQEGLLSLDDRVLKFFPRAKPLRTPELWDRLLVRHLLTMTMGFDKDPIDRVVTARDWAKALFTLELDHEPGTRFVYNNMASYLASVVVQQATGESLREWLVPRLFEPLGIPDPAWDVCPQRRTIGGWGLYLTVDEVARVGQFLLNQGVGGGRPLMAPALVDLASSLHVETGSNPVHDSHQGYGLQIWRCRHDAFRGDGAFGQLCVVWPARELVVAVQAGVPDAQPVLDAVWRHFASDEAEPGDPLPLQGHRPPPVPGSVGQAQARVEPWLERAWRLVDHPAGWQVLGISGTSAAPVFWYDDDRGRHQAPWGWGTWVESLSGLWRHDSQRRRRFVTLASGHWEDPDRLVLTLRFPEQAPVVTLTLDFREEGLLLSQHLSVTLQPSNFQGLRGLPVSR